MRRVLPILAVLALLLPGFARAGEAPEAKRRVVYVPHEDMDALLEQQGRGVVLSVAEYLELFEKAHAAGFTPKTKPAADAVVLAGLVTGKVLDGSFELSATFFVRSLAEGLTRVAFPIRGAGVGDVLVDGKPGLLSADKDGGYLLLPEKGDHDVKITLTGRPIRTEEVRIVSLGLPAAAALAFDLVLPAGSEFGGLPAGGSFRAEESAEGVRVAGYVPPFGDLTFTWRPRRDQGSTETVLTAVARTLHRVGPRRLETIAMVHVDVWRKPIRELVLQLPAGDAVTEVAAANLAGWSQDATGKVTLRFAADAFGRQAIVLSAERNLPGPGDLVLPLLTVPGAADESGLTAVAFTPGVEGRVISATGCAREPIPDHGVKDRAEGGEWELDRIVLTDAAAAYRYWSKDRAITVRTSVPETKVTCTVTALFEIGESMSALRADFDYRVTGGRLFSLSPSFPPDYEVLDVTVNAPVPSRHEALPGGVIRIEFPAGVPADSSVQVTVALRAVPPAPYAEGASVPIPVPEAGPGVEATGRMAVFADDAFEVKESNLTGFTPESVERLGLPGARFGYGWRKEKAAGRLVLTRRLPEVTVRHLAVVSPGERTARYTGFLHYTIRRAGVKTFRFLVPGGFGDRLHVMVPGGIEAVRRAGEEGRDAWEVNLPSAVRGEFAIRLDLEADTPLSEGRRSFVVPEVLVPDMADETGWVAVESGENMEVTAKATGLRDIASGEIEELLTRLFGFVPSRGLFAAFRYTAHPWSLVVETMRYEEAKLPTAFVRSASLVTVVARDGTTRTRATYALLNAGRQFLRVILPPSCTLWGALVAGKPVKPAMAGGAALVPLSSAGAESALEVVLIYEGSGHDLKGNGVLTLFAPEIAGVAGAEAEWSVWLPAGYSVTGTKGVFGAAPPAPRDPWLFRFLGSLGGIAAMGAAKSETAAAPAGDAVSEPREGGRRLLAMAKAPPMPAKAVAPEMAPGLVPGPAAEPAADPGVPADLPGRPGEGKFEDGGKDTGRAHGAHGVGGKGGPAAKQPPEILGREGGLSLDVALLTGGSVEVVRAVGVRGGVELSYLDGERRKDLAAVLGVAAAVATILLAVLLRRKVPPFVVALLVLAFGTAAPAMFAARDNAIFDAIAQGGFAAFLLVVVSWPFRRLARRAKPAAAAVAALLFLCLAAPAVLAAPEPPPPSPDTVYVPYDPKDVGSLEKAGQVFVPFERFRELWNAAHPEKRIDKPSEAPVPWLLTGIGLSASVEEETLRIEAVLDLVVLAEGWVEVALPFAPAVAEEAKVDGEPVRVLAKDGAHVLVLKGQGARRVELVLRAGVRREGEVRVVETARPAVPRTLLTLAEPFPGAEVTILAPGEPVKDGAVYRVLLGVGDKLDIRWRPKMEAVVVDSRVEVETREALGLEEGKTEFAMWTEWRAVSGSISMGRFSLDPDYRLLAVSGSDVKTFVEKDGVLTVTFSREVKDKTHVYLYLIRADAAREKTVGVPAVAPIGVVRERGLLAVSVAPSLKAVVTGPRNLERIAAKPEDFSEIIGPGGTVHSAFRFVSRPLSLTIAVEAMKAEVRVEVPVQHLVSREFLLSRATFNFDVRGDGTFEFPVMIPAAAEIESVTGAGLARWWRDGDVVTFSTASPVRGAFSVNVAWRTPLAPDAVQVPLPEVHAVGVNRERGQILVAHAPALSLTLLSDEGLVKEDVAAYGTFEKIDRDQVNAYGWRQEGGAYRLAVARTFPEARIHPVTTTHLQIEDDRVVVTAYFAFTIENAGADTFRVFLPAGEGEDPIVTADRQRTVKFEAAEVEGRKGQWLTLTLKQPATGSYGFSVVYEKPLDAAGRAEIVGLEPEGDSPAAFAFAVNLSRGEVTFDRGEGLEPTNVASLPYLPEGVGASVFAAFRGRGASWRLPVALKIHEFADFPDALITSAELTTAVGRTGEMRSRMTYLLLNRTRQFLEVTLPAGAELEAVRVSGRGVKPGRRVVGKEERILVPLSRMQLGDVSTEVEIFWTLPPRNAYVLTDFALHEPVVHGLTVERTFFTVIVPEGYRYSFDGNMRAIVETAQQVWRLEKQVEEFERLNDVSNLGSSFERARADDNRAQLRSAIEKSRQELAENLKLGVGALAGDETVAGLNKEQREDLRKQVTEQTAKLGQLQQKLEMADRESRRVPQSGAFFNDGQDGDYRARAENTYDAKEQAKQQAEEQYRFAGKKAASSRGWASNAMPGDDGGGGRAGQEMQPQAQEEIDRNALVKDALGRLIEYAPDTHIGTLSERTFLVVPQTVVPGQRLFAGEGDVSLVPSGGAGFSFEGGVTADSYGWGGGGGGGGARAAAEVRAGLLSLPVHVPTQGIVHRFEKLNGGAKLEVSVGSPGAGRAPLALGIFLAVAVALLVLARLLRRR